MRIFKFTENYLEYENLKKRWNVCSIYFAAISKASEVRTQT